MQVELSFHVPFEPFDWRADFVTTMTQLATKAAIAFIKEKYPEDDGQFKWGEPIDMMQVALNEDLFESLAAKMKQEAIQEIK